MSNHTSSTKTVGIDLGDKQSTFCILDVSGEVIERGDFRTSMKGLLKKFDGMPPATFTIEVGTHSPWVSRLLADLGHEVLVANARMVRLIHSGLRKSDRLDPEKLARLTRVDASLLSPIQHRGEDAQAHLAIIRARDTLVGARTKLILHVRGAVKSMGSRLPSCSTKCFPRTVREQIPEQLVPALSGLLDQLENMTSMIDAYDKTIEGLCHHRYTETDVLRQIKGVGPILALTYVLTIEDPHRFKKSRQVGAYLGLTPRLSESGAAKSELRITKAGDVMLRRLLVTGAHYILGPFGPETDLREFGERIAAKGAKQAKKRAVVAVARKLAVLLHSLWKTGEVYDPLRKRQRTKSSTLRRAS